MDYLAITSAVSFTDLMAAIGVVAAGVAVLYIGIRGARTLLQFVRR